MIKVYVRWYLVLLILHFAHVGEEVLGNAPFIQEVYGGMSTFLLLMLIGFLFPLFLLAYSAKHRLAYLLSYGYAGIMILDGVSHLVQRVAGIYTGIGLLIVGSLLLNALYYETRSPHTS